MNRVVNRKIVLARELLTVFNEDFVFDVWPATRGRKSLELILYDSDAYSRRHSI